MLLKRVAGEKAMVLVRMDGEEVEHFKCRRDHKIFTEALTLYVNIQYA